MPRRTREEAREDLLAAGERIFDRGVADGLSPLEALTRLVPKAVTEEAGYTAPGIIYHHWPTPAAYGRDVRTRLARRLDSTSGDLDVDWPPDPTWRQVCALGAASEQARIAAEPTLALYLTLVAETVADGVLADALTHSNAESDQIQRSDVIEPLLALANRRARSPFDTHDITVLIRAAVEGVALAELGGSDVARKTFSIDGVDNTALGVMVTALIALMTEDVS